MPNYVDNIDIIDANGQTTNVLLQDRGTLALANENATKVNNIIDRVDNLKIFNVLDYGAVGDGVTDDTVAINLAIADVNNQSRSALFFPSGKYRISTTLTPITTQCDIFGSGGSSVLLLASGHGTIFSLSNFYRGQLHDLAFIEENPPAVSNDPVIVLTTGNYGMFYNICITNVKNFLKIGGDDPTDPGYMTTVENVFGIVTGNFVNLTGCRNVTYIHNVSINSEPEYSSTVAIAINDIRGIDTLVVSDSIFQRFYYGFTINQSDTSITTSNIWLDNVVFDNIYTRGIVGNIKGKLYRLFVNNTWVSMVSGNSYEAILLQTSDSSAKIDTVYIENCKIPFCYYYAIHILKCGGFKISDCHIPSFTTHAIVLSDVSKGIISNNIFGNDGSNTPAATGDGVNGVNMSDAVLSGNFADGYALSGSNWSNCRVIGNVGWVDNP